MRENFKFDNDSTKNEGRLRLKNPKIFRDYFRKNYWPGPKQKDGISYIIGINTTNGNFEVQAIRFKKSIVSEEQAGQWWKENSIYFIKEQYVNKYNILNM